MPSDSYRLVTLEDAQKVAKIFLQDGRICGVEVFGSVARRGRGDDLDLILLVESRTISTEFILQTKLAIKEKIEAWNANAVWDEPEDDIAESPHHAYDLGPRDKVAIALLGSQFEHLFDQAVDLLPPRLNSPRNRSPRNRLDLFILPRTWREETRILQEGFPQGDPKFWENLKREAITLC